MLYLGVVSTFLGYIGWNVGLRGLGATRAVAYAHVISPLAVAFGAVLLDEPVTRGSSWAAPSWSAASSPPSGRASRRLRLRARKREPPAGRPAPLRVPVG